MQLLSIPLQDGIGFLQRSVAQLAGRPSDEPDRVASAVVATVATAGRAVFFSGLTVLLGLIGLVLFEFMILRSVGIAGAIVVLLAVVSDRKSVV